MRKISRLLFAATLILQAGAVRADFDAWTFDIQEDPFDGKGKLAIDVMDNIASALVVLCEEGSSEVVFRRATPIPFADFSSSDKDFISSIIVDKGARRTALSRAVQLGNGNLGFDAKFTRGGAKDLLQELSKAKQYVYFKLGSADSERFTGKGLGVAATRALTYCFAP